MDFITRGNTVMVLDMDMGNKPIKKVESMKVNSKTTKEMEKAP